MLRIALRDTLNRHGIPGTWIAGEGLLVNSRTQQTGIHLRLVIKHWDPRLMTYGVALQYSLIKRITTFDPVAGEWLLGISWQFALVDESQCPPMPRPGLWTADPPSRSERAAPATPRPAGDVIAGPERIHSNGSVFDAAAGDRPQMLAVRDASRRSHADAAHKSGFDVTQPMYLQTRPTQL